MKKQTRMRAEAAMGLASRQFACITCPQQLKNNHMKHVMKGKFVYFNRQRNNNDYHNE